MLNTKLTIAIPTYNRSRYLKELVPEIINQCININSSNIELLIIDNASTDDTQAYIKANYAGVLTYIRNKNNIGADRNFIECIKNSKGEYIWLFGDDEILTPGGVQRVIKSLNENPDLIIAESNFDATLEFESYKNLLLHTHDKDPVFPVHHTLITKNIFRKSGFNCDFANKKIDTNYGHMYGLIDSLKQAKKIIVFSQNESAFSIREHRAAFADPPNNLEKKLVDLNCFIADSIEYKRLKKDIWLYYNMRPIYKLINSRKTRKLLGFLN